MTPLKSGRHDLIFVALLYMVGGIGVAISVSALRVAGIGWDATFVTAAADAARAVKPGMGLEEAYLSVPNTNEFYGFLTNQLADLAFVIFGSGQSSLTPYNPETYLWLGIVNITISILGAASMAWAVTVALKSRLGGALTWAVLLTIPLWVGMSHMNDRDIPVAAGLTMVSSALVLSWCWHPRSQSIGWITPVLIGGAGGSLALGTRAGILLPLFALLCGSLALWALVAWLRQSWSQLLRPLTLSLSTPVFAVAFCWITDPIARISLIRWLYDSYSYSGGDFPWTVATRTNGIDIPMDAMPWWFAAAWLGAQLPLLISACLLGTLVIVVVRVFGHGPFSVSAHRLNLVALIPFVVQGFVLPVAAIVMGAQFYDGIRHLTFILPAIAVGVSVFLFYLVSIDRRSIRMAGVSFALVVLTANLWADIRWYPYSYAFINPIAGRDKDERDWELDYWGTSAREGVAKLQDLKLTPIVVLPHGEPGRPFGAVNLTDPGSGILDPVILEPQPGQVFGYYWFRRFEYPDELAGCTPIFTVERDGHVLGEGGECVTPL